MSTTATTPVTGTWTIDPVHSSVGFSVKHIVSRFRAGFEQVQGTFDGDAGVLTGSAPVDSIDVRNEDFRGHLLSPDFFDAANHPEIAFRSTALDFADDGTVTATGELTLLGVTKPITATGEVTEVSAGPAGDVFGLELEATVDRNDFGLTWNMEAPGGKKVVGDEVRITVSLELGRPAS